MSTHPQAPKRRKTRKVMAQKGFSQKQPLTRAQKAMRAKAKEKKGIAAAARLRGEGIYT